MPELNAVNRSTLREQVLSNLREGILSGSLPPGTKLAEADLADQLGVSRGTVREALRHLQQSGLAVGAERNSLRVRKLSGTESTELFELRAALEGQAARRIAHRADRAEIVRRLEAQLPRESPGVDYAELFADDIGFHRAICEESGNAMLLKAWQSVEDLMWITVMAKANEASRPLMTRENHAPLLDAIRNGDDAEIYQAFMEHMERAADLWAS